MNDPYRELFEAVFFKASDAMLIFDDNRTVIEANPAACALFAVLASVVALPALAATSPKDSFTAIQRQVESIEPRLVTLPARIGS